MDEKSENENTFKVADKRRFSPEGEVKEETLSSEASPQETGDAGEHEELSSEESGLRELTFNSFIVSLATQALM